MSVEEFVSAAARDTASILSRAGRRIEMASELAEPVALRSAARLLGLTDIEARRIAPRVRLITGFDPAEDERDIRRARGELDRFFLQIVSGGRSRTRPGLLPHLLGGKGVVGKGGFGSAGKVGGGPMGGGGREGGGGGGTPASGNGGREPSARESAAVAMVGFASAYLTTQLAIASGVLSLAEAPGRILALRRSAKRFVDEVFRFHTPFQEVMRRATREVRVRGNRIPEGAVIVAWLAAANRDPEHFSSADRFLPLRVARANLAFGAGWRACLASHIARAELAAVLGVVADACHGLRLDGRRGIEMTPHAVFFGPRKLFVHRAGSA